MVFSEPRYPRYAIDLFHPAIRYAIAAAITVSGRYAATFPNNGPCLTWTALTRARSMMTNSQKYEIYRKQNP